ncbi:MDR family oxidoreductase [Paraferrimonas sp. SM1919]|uniref:MDR family oxidoreductase n=1 Tax=Paraferrimonas sp. SM1919 TaxID=2662263 RepID=UPI0013D75BDC|nr:MDR family oxidoreductase [Paraferrimonas sp. SM1919]
MFNALVLEQQDKKTIAAIKPINLDDLYQGDVVVKVSYSSLNYKDGLAITGAGKIIRNFPMVPGIDFSGVVHFSEHPKYQVGDEVILTGWGVGETHPGGMAEFARVKGDWLVPMPKGCDGLKAMQIGTAGLTAALCVQALVDHGITPEQGPILVTGASGGVGSTSVALLAKLGYEVVAVSGRSSNHEYLKSLGATQILARDEFDIDGRPLDKQKWAGVVDTVGNKVLATALTQINYGGAAAICGLAGGFALPTTVMPFILRGVCLLGIDSVYCPYSKRLAAWKFALDNLGEDYFKQATTLVSLSDVEQQAQDIVAGKVTGRVAVKL